MDKEYAYASDDGVPFARIIIANRPQDITEADELAVLESAFKKATQGKVLVEFDSPVSLVPECLAKIQFFNRVKEVWVAAGAPKVTFLTPPRFVPPPPSPHFFASPFTFLPTFGYRILWTILRTLDISYTEYD